MGSSSNQEMTVTTTKKKAGCSIYQVAEKAGVSIVTVSRVFNDYPHVSNRMKNRVFDAARQVGYTPRLVSKPKVLAAVVGDIDHINAGDYKARLILNIIRYASKAGYLVEYIPFDSMELATKNLVDGIIELGLTQAELAKIQEIPNVPVAVINKRAMNDKWFTVSSDHYKETQIATQHLINHGHRKIALILDEISGWEAERKEAGYVDTLSDAEVDAKPIVISASEFSPGEISARIVNEGCTACVNLTDNYGFAVLDALTNEMGLSIPDDISVICHENESSSPYYKPRLTTIAQPLEKIAKCVISSITEKLEGARHDPAEHLFAGRLIERDSVKRLT